MLYLKLYVDIVPPIVNHDDSKTSRFRFSRYVSSDSARIQATLQVYGHGPLKDNGGTFTLRAVRRYNLDYK